MTQRTTGVLLGKSVERWHVKGPPRHKRNRIAQKQEHEEVPNDDRRWF